MYIVLTGGAGNITKLLALQLLDEENAVIVISRNADNLKELTEAGAIAEIGSVEDVAFLTNAFTRADAVYTMVPPNMAAPDWQDWYGQVGENYAAALKAAGVKHVVNLSSYGAHLPEGAGPVSGLYRVEQSLNMLDGDVSVVHLRPAYFYNNLLSNIDLIRHMGIMGANWGGEGFTLPIVDPSDIAAVAAEELVVVHENRNRKVRYVISDEVTSQQIASTLGSAIGKPDLQWVVFSDEQFVQGAMQAGLPEHGAKSYAELGASMRSGKLDEDYQLHKPETMGKVKLADFAKTFAAAYGV